MLEKTIQLETGLKLGEVVHKDAVIREEMVGDMIAAIEASEKVISTPEGYQVLSNVTLAGLLSLGQQIVRIGEIPGPLGRLEMAKLTSADLELLREEADAMSLATLAAATQRGRSDPPSE